MAANTTTSNASVIAPRILADRILGANRPGSALLASLANIYSLRGEKSGVKTLNKLGDSGPATAGTEGTAFTTETVLSYDTAVDLTPTEAAMRLMVVTNRVIQQRSGYDNALALFNSGNVDAIVAALDIEARDIMSSLMEKLEADLAALFSSLSSSVGALASDFSLDVVEQALFTFDILDLPANAVARRAICASPRFVSDIRRELQVTSGGVQGVMWGSQQSLVAQSSDGVEPIAALFGVPVYQMSQSIVPTSGTVPGSGGHVCALIVRGSGNPEEEGGSGEVGTLQFCEGAAPQFAVDFSGRGRSVDLLGVHDYAVALRTTGFGVKILGDDA